MKAEELPDDECRVHPKLRNLLDECHRAKGILTEDEANYAVGWDSDGVDINDREEYRYASWKELNGLPVNGRLDRSLLISPLFPLKFANLINNFGTYLKSCFGVFRYSGGGYVWKLSQPTIECCGREDIIETVDERVIKLSNESWIDQHTRALFVEFSLFNPAVRFLFSLI